MKKLFILIFFMLLLFVTGCNNNVVITFDSNGGSEVSSITIEKGTCVIEPTAPIKSGEEFVGWFYNNE